MRLGTYYRSLFLKLLGIKADKSCVLDVGCFDAYWLSTQTAKERYALDIDIDKKYKNVIYVKASGLKIPFTDNKFNQVFAFDVIEHIPQDTEAKFFSELIRVTKPRGEITVTVPSKDIRVFPSFLTDWVSKRWGHTKYNGLSKKELENYLKKFNLNSYKLIEFQAQVYLKYYFFVRLLWKVNQEFSKNLVEKIALKDYQNMRGTKGYYIIRIIK